MNGTISVPTRPIAVAMLKIRLPIPEQTNALDNVA
jgi:hypothetical protein